jgi:predicted ferric reductase
MSEQFWWHLTRASANVSMVLVLFAILWGVLLSTRILMGSDNPPWIRDLHTWLGGLSLAFAALHMASLIADSYIQFSVVDVLVPFVGSWRPLAAALGIVAFWLLVAVQGTSLFMRRIPRTLWRRVHMLSYLLFGIVVAHSLAAGSDVGTPLYTGFSMAVAMTGAAVGGIRLVAGRAADRRRKARTAGTDPSA